MDREVIIKAIREALDKNSHKFKKTIKDASSLPEEYSDLFINNELSKPIKSALDTLDEFSKDTKNLIHGDGIHYAFNAYQASTLLIAKARKTGNIEFAVSWLEKILATKKAVGHRIVALWGINLLENVQLTEDIDIVPIGNLPESKMRDNLLNYSNDIFKTPMLPLDPPTTALKYRVILKPFISNNQKDTDGISDHFTKRENFINEILLVLTLIGPCTPTRYLSWFQFEDPDLEETQMLGYGFPHHEILPMTFNNYGAWDSEVAKRLVNNYTKLTGTIKNKVQVALQRLNQALRRSNVGDRALEISIALESLLSDGMSENTFKIGLRSSLILGGDTTHMLHVRAIVGGTYILRSALVHNGKVNETVNIVREGKKNSKDVVDEAIIICAKIIQNIIETQYIPDWYTFELSKTE